MSAQKYYHRYCCVCLFSPDFNPRGKRISNFKIIFGYVMSLRSAWTTWALTNKGEDSEMAQWTKLLLIKSDNLSSISDTNIIQGENQLPNVVLWPPYMCHGMCMLKYTINSIKIKTNREQPANYIKAQIKIMLPTRMGTDKDQYKIHLDPDFSLLKYEYLWYLMSTLQLFWECMGVRQTAFWGINKHTDIEEKYSCNCS